jgi:hypothetical protein
MDRRAGALMLSRDVVPLAVLLDAVGKVAQAPIFLLLDLAALAFDDGLEMGGERVHRCALMSWRAIRRCS